MSPSSAAAAVVTAPSDTNTNTASSAPTPPSSSSSSTSRPAAPPKKGGIGLLFRMGSKSSAPAPLPLTSTATAMNRPSLDAMGTNLTTSAPTILIRTPSDSSLPFVPTDPPRGIMTSRTLHESLHNRRYSTESPSNSNSSNNSTSKLGLQRTVSFTNVNIREYERILGDNPSVTGGPPLSIGWRHTLEPITMKLDDYEGGKGSPRSSSEYLVPKAVREKLLKEHACVSRRDMAITVRSIQKEKAKRRKTVTNLNLAGAEELLENVTRNIKTILKPSSTYSNKEAKLWDEAHVVAMEKAKRLEESIHRGESVRASDFYKVGTICNSGHGGSSNGGDGASGSRRHTAPVGGSSSLAEELNMDGGARRNTAPNLGTSTLSDVSECGGDRSEDGDSVVEVVGEDGDGGSTLSSPSKAKPPISSGTIEQPQSQQQPQETSTTCSTPQRGATAEGLGGNGFSPASRRGSHTGSIIVATECDEADDVLASLNLDEMNISS